MSDFVRTPVRTRHPRIGPGGAPTTRRRSVGVAAPLLLAFWAATSSLGASPPSVEAPPGESIAVEEADARSFRGFHFFPILERSMCESLLRDIEVDPSGEGAALAIEALLGEILAVERDIALPNRELERDRPHPSDPHYIEIWNELQRLRHEARKRVAAAETAFFESIRPIVPESSLDRFEVRRLERRAIRAGGLTPSGPIPGAFPTLLALASEAGIRPRDPAPLAEQRELLNDLAALLERRFEESWRTVEKDRQILKEYFELHESAHDPATRDLIARLSARREAAVDAVQTIDRRILAANRRAIEWAKRSLDP